MARPSHAETPTLKRGAKVAVSLTGTVVRKPRRYLPHDEYVVQVRVDGLPYDWWAVVPLSSVKEQQ